MPLIYPVKIEAANADQKKVLSGIMAKMGKIPNIYATLAHSPVVLEALLANGAALKKGVLTPKEIEAIALAVGQANDCDYCVAAHTVIGKMSGLSDLEVLEARKSASKDKKTDTLIKLAVEIVKTNGKPSCGTINAFKEAGYPEAALVEVIAWVSQNIFTNYFNHIAGTEVDFPKPPAIN